MSTGALIMMIGWQGMITLVAGYFFWKVLTAKPKSDNPADEDSYSETKNSEK